MLKYARFASTLVQLLLILLREKYEKYRPLSEAVFFKILRARFSRIARLKSTRYKIMYPFNYLSSGSVISFAKRPTMLLGGRELALLKVANCFIRINPCSPIISLHMKACKIVANLVAATSIIIY